MALLNALKWAGATKGTSYEMVPSWCDACRTTKRKGTSFIDLFRAARTLPLIGVRKAKPKVKLADINAHLKYGGAVILGSFSESMNGFHWFLVTERINLAGKISYRVVNFDHRTTQCLVSARMIKNSMRLAIKRSGMKEAAVCRKDYPCAIFLQKNRKEVI